MEIRKKELTAQEFVYEFGTSKQKKSFEQQKKIVTNIKKALIRQAQTEYEKVEIVKKGRSNIYVLSGKFDDDERLVKQDGRHDNGSYSIAYTKDIDLIVLSLLLDKSIETDTSQTMRKWLFDFGLISRELFHLLGVTHDKRRKINAVDTLVSENILKSKEESSAIDDYIRYTKELQSQLESSLNRMMKANIINFYPVYWAKLNARDAEGKRIDKRIRITERCIAMINSHKRNLMDKLNVTDFDILNLHNKKEVKLFNSRYKNFLRNDVTDEGEHISIDYFYKAHAIHIKATDKRIKFYVNQKDSISYELLLHSKIEFMDSHIDHFKKERIQRVVDLATKKANYIENSKLNIEGFPDFAELFGVEEILNMTDMRFNREYYKLFLNNSYIDTIKDIEIYYSLDLKKEDQQAAMNPGKEAKIK